MDKKNSHERIPLGRASDLENRKEVLPAIEVKNKVRWVNDQINLPLYLEVGASTHLGLFLTQNEEAGQYHLEITPKHGRSALLGRVIFSDKQGNLFREIDLKGAGYVLKDELYPDKRPMTRVGSVAITKDALRERSMGILDLKDAEKDRDMSELFYESGIRVPRVAGLIELDEIVDQDGKKISVEDAKRKGLILPDADVGIEVRVFVTRARIADSDTDNWDDLVNDARKIVAQELGKDEHEFSNDDYALWFAKTLGTNIGKMNSLGYFHGFLTRQNVTLDCRIVDFDSVRRYEEVPEDWRRMMLTTVRKIIGFVPDISDIKQLAVLHDYVLAYSSLENFLLAIGFHAGRDHEILKKISVTFEEGYHEAGGQELPKI